MKSVVVKMRGRDAGTRSIAFTLPKSRAVHRSNVLFPFFYGLLAEEFRKTGASVYVIDKTPGDWFVGDIADPPVLERFVASDKAGFITGENVCVDGGMTRQMIYHNDFGWTKADNP